MIGTVLWFKNELGYGFLKDDETEDEIYFHFSAIISDKEYKTLFGGQPVEFDLTKDNGGKAIAINVKPTQRINKQTNKPIILIAYVNIANQITVNDFHIRISLFQKAGAVHLNEFSKLLISSDSSLNEEEVSIIGNIILGSYNEIEKDIEKGLRKVFNTGNFKYDIIFL